MSQGNRNDGQAFFSDTGGGKTAKPPTKKAKKGKSSPTETADDAGDASKTAARIGVNKLDMIEIAIAEVVDVLKVKEVEPKPETVSLIRRKLAEYCMRCGKMEVAQASGKKAKTLKDVESDAIFYV